MSEGKWLYLSDLRNSIAALTAEVEEKDKRIEELSDIAADLQSEAWKASDRVAKLEAREARLVKAIQRTRDDIKLVIGGEWMTHAQKNGVLLLLSMRCKDALYYHQLDDIEGIF